MKGKTEPSEHRYRRLLAAVTDYIFTVRVEHGRAVETIHGPGCVAVTGYTPDEFAASPLLWITMVPPADRPAVEQQVTQIRAGREPAPIEHRIQRKDGEIRWVVNTTVPYFDSAGKLVSYDGLLHDITERKTAEQVLRQLNETLEQRVAEQTREVRLLVKAVAHLGEGVLITDDRLDLPGPRIVFVNEAMCRITGYSADELIGRTPRMLQAAASDRQALDRLKRELLAGRSAECELVNYRKDGTAYDAQLFITPLFDSQEMRTNFVSIHRDVTERNRAERALRDREQRLRAILKTAVDAIITIDRYGIIQAVNPATERMFGYLQEELIGQNVNLLMPPPYHDEHDGYLARYLETGRAKIIGIGREVTARRKDGSVFPVDLAVSEIDMRNRSREISETPAGSGEEPRSGDVTYGRLFTGIVHDITPRKELETEVLRIAEEEQRRIGQDLHDGIGQQLTGLGIVAEGFVEAMRRPGVKRSLDDAGLSYLRDIAKRLSDGLGAALEQVRQLSSGLVPVDVDAQGLMAALDQLASSIGRLHGVACTFHCENPVAIDNRITATHLYRIAQEATSNALRHSQAPHIWIVLSEEAGCVTLEVQDNGIGFDNLAAANERPAGMGLRIMQYRAGLIGATVRHETVAEGGTRVVCSVPNSENWFASDSEQSLTRSPVE